jgi:hypothetical protein
MSAYLTLLLARFHAVCTVLQLCFSQFRKIIVALLFSLCLESVMYVPIKLIRIKKDRKIMSLLE